MAVKWYNLARSSSPDVFWNGSPEVLRLLLDLGCDRFYCRNRSELRLALDEAGLPPSTVVFAPCPVPAVASHLKVAHAAGVAAIAFSTGNDLAKIAARAPGSRLD